MNWRGKGLLAIGIVIIVATAAAVVVMADVLGLAIWSPAQTVAGSAAPTISSDCPPVASGDATALPAALFLGNTPGPVITPQQASRVATAFWPIEEKALAADDRTTTNLIESGPAAEYANAVSCEDILSNHSTRTVRRLQSVNVYVPRQMGYPARFLAEVGTKVYATGPINAPGAAPPPGTPWIDYLVFTRVDESHPWQVVIDTGYSGGVSVDALTPEDASVTPVFDAPPPRPDWIDPSSVPQLLADYWQHWATIGGPPPVDQFTSGFWTTARGAYLQQTKPIDLAKGVVHNNVRYFVDLARDGTYEFAVDNGVDLVCFTVRYEDHLTGVSNAPLLQND